MERISGGIFLVEVPPDFFSIDPHSIFLIYWWRFRLLSGWI